MRFITPLTALFAATACALPKPQPQLSDLPKLPGLNEAQKLTQNLPGAGNLIPRQGSSPPSPSNSGIDVVNITVTIDGILDDVLNEVKALLSDLKLAIDIETQLFTFVTTTYQSVATNTTTTIINGANNSTTITTNTTTTTTTTTTSSGSSGNLISDLIDLVLTLVDDVLAFVQKELGIFLQPFGLAVEVETQIFDIVINGVKTFETRVQSFIQLVPVFKN